MTQSLADMRRDYTRDGLSEEQAPLEPFALFHRWFAEAVQTEQLPVEANAMTLATVDAEGQPHCRVLLLKALDERGFTFFTNYDSAKGEQLLGNPRAAMTFFWPALERQVRITGIVHKVSEEESDTYFHSRPLGSQIGASVSPQSQMIESREWLEEKYKQTERGLSGKNPPRPEHWGGFLVKPVVVECWQGRPSRLHDRLEYSLAPDGNWVRVRLAP